MEELLQACSVATGYERKIVDTVIHSFLDQIADELAQGHVVDLGKEFGVFSTKFVPGRVQENSPRTPKANRYRVVFRENCGLHRRLKVQEGE